MFNNADFNLFQMHPIFTQYPFKSNEAIKNTNPPFNLFHNQLKQEFS